MNNLAVDIGIKFFGGQGGSHGGVGSSFANLSGIGYLVSLIVKGSFVLSGIIILFFFIMAGIGMISGAGGDDPKKTEQAKATMTSAVIGFVIVFTSYWIVKLIGQLIGMPDLI
ncbi:MAG: hypothetical protein AAB535_04280 [Patescibacteria group bacterium]